MSRRIDYVASLPATVDVVVVGGGIAGAATAFFAEHAGLRTLLVERRPALCTLTTAVAAGGFRLQLDDPLELPLVQESVDTYQRFREVTQQDRYDPALREQGYLWATRTEDGVERQRQLVELQQGWGVDDIELLDGDTARERFRFLTAEVRQVRFRQRDGLIDPKAISFGFALGSGAMVAVGCEVRNLVVRGDRVVGVQTSHGEVATDTVVLAAGPFAPDLAAAQGVIPPSRIIDQHRVVVWGIPDVPADAPMTIDEETGTHWRPAFGGAYIMVPAPPQEGTASDPVPIDPGRAFDVLRPTEPDAAAHVTSWWRTAWEHGAVHWALQAGQWVSTPDRRALIGPTPLEGLHLNTGYGGHGVMGASGGARLLVDLLIGADRPDAAAFAFDRSFERSGVTSVI